MKKEIKNVIKKSALVLTALASALALASCKGDDGNKEKVEIKIVTSERSKMEFFQSEVEKFNNENDQNIEVSIDFKADNVTELIKTAYTSNDAPDIHLGMGASMDKLAIENDWYRKVPEEAIKEWKDDNGSNSVNYIEGEVYTLKPVSALNGPQGFKFLWNKALFEAAGLNPENPPKTWNEVREYAKKITEVGNGVKYGYVMPFKDAIFTRYYIVIPGATSGLYNADGYNPVNGKYDFSMYEPIIDVYRGMIEDGSVFPSPYTVDNDTARAQFAEGNIGMICAARWDVDVFNDQFPVKDEWGIADYPVIDEFKGGNPYCIGTGSSYYMSNKSKYPEEQLEVYKWFLSLNEDEETKSKKKGFKEFTENNYPIAKVDGVLTPASLLKLEGKDCWEMIKNIVLSETDITAGLQQISDTYNAAVEKAINAGENIEAYIYPEYSYYASSEEELEQQSKALSMK